MRRDHVVERGERVYDQNALGRVGDQQHLFASQVPAASPDRGWEHDDERVGNEEGTSRVQMGDDGVLDNGELQCLSRVPAQFAKQGACGDAAGEVDPAQAVAQ